MKTGFDHEKYPRLRSGLLYSLNKLSEEGHCYSRREQLLKTGAELLTVEEELLSGALDEMIRSDDLKVEKLDDGDEAIYLPPFYYSEVGTAKRLKQIRTAPRQFTVKRAGLEDLVSLGRDTVKDDFAAFLDAGCPAVNLIDFEYGSAPGMNDYWHTVHDTMDKISDESLLKAGMLVAELLNMLEGNVK